jgi:hypothetical protein
VEVAAGAVGAVGPAAAELHNQIIIDARESARGSRLNRDAMQMEKPPPVAGGAIEPSLPRGGYHFLMRSRNDIGKFLNRLGLLGRGVEVGAARGDFSRVILESWQGKKLYLGGLLDAAGQV